MALRALVAGEIAVSATGVASICALGLLGVYARVSDEASADIGGFAVMAIACAVYASLTWMSDGLSGSMVLAAPVLPLLAGLLLGKRAAKKVTLLTGAFLLLVLSQHFVGNLQRDETFPEEVRYSMRVLVLLLMLVGINWLLSFYELMARSQVAYPERDVFAHNPLTGLLQPEAFEQVLEAEFEKARADNAQFSLALVQIDDLEHLRKEFGDAGAETCIAGVADALRFCMRRGSDDIGRYDASRLCILMRDSGKGMQRVVEKFHKLMQTLDLVVGEGQKLRLAVSIGYCSEPAAAGHTAQDVSDGARRALAQAVEQGGNRWLRETLA